MNQMIRKIKNTILRWLPDVLTAALIIYLYESGNSIAFYTFIIIIALFFVYRIYLNPDDIMYLAREQLEMTIFGKPFKMYEKGEKIKMKKFVWRKSK